MIALDAITIVLDEESQLALTIASKAIETPFECTERLDQLPPNFLGAKTNTPSSPPIRFDPAAPHRGLQRLALQEVHRYFIAVHHLDSGINADGSSFKIRSSLQGIRGTGWDPVKVGHTPTVNLQAINYIGVAWIEVDGFDRIKFDITPAKFGYEDDYRSMVETIADKCQQLLLEWNAPTTLTFASDPTEAKRTLLEQFLFLRHCLGTERLDLYLEILNRNPHRTLVSEDRWETLPGTRFATDPVRYGRDWCPSANASAAHFKGFFPQEVNATNKRETLDTAPNRFVKYALGHFREICQIVLDHEEVEGAAHDEAYAMRESLDAFLAQSWLWEVGDLDQIPLNNQTLLKREGYRQILEAWFLSDVAAQLDWEGREDVYDGNNRDVATLYEYWLYFELFDILAEEAGCEKVSSDSKDNVDEPLPFMVMEEGKGLKVNLKQGRPSYMSFRHEVSEGVTNRLNLYYNRSFSQRDVLAAGTYSRPLRPDFTLVILPDAIAENYNDSYRAEAKAEELGQITYLHFDAKYRVENITQIFGDGSKGEIDEERREEKVTKTYKRGDLYKMHTYNEAIRRTVGSYVLYPGTDHENDSSFPKYHEVLPGVGAFALKPAIVDDKPSSEGRLALSGFLKDVIRHHASRMTQLSRLNDSTHRIVKEAPISGAGGGDGIGIANPDTPVVLGFMRPEESEKIRERGYFYCRALNDNGVPTKMNLSLAEGALLTGYNGANQERISAGWCAEVIEVRIVSPSQLTAETKETPSRTDVPYILFRFRSPWRLKPRDLTGIAPAAGGLAVQTTWLALNDAPVVRT